MLKYRLAGLLSTRTNCCVLFIKTKRGQCAGQEDNSGISAAEVD